MDNSDTLQKELYLEINKNYNTIMKNDIIIGILQNNTFANKLKILYPNLTKKEININVLTLLFMMKITL
jgi:hypothetical protein